jgi:hypothetical protein
MANSSFSAEEAELWERVNELWRLTRDGKIEEIKSAFHPKYSGWVTGIPEPHGLAFAFEAAASDEAILQFSLTPLKVIVTEESIGIVHYTYSALVMEKNGMEKKVTGRWTEIHVKKGGKWLFLSVQGGPDN